MTVENLHDLRRELERTRADLVEAKARIAWMEASRFWRLRNAWWGFRERLNRAVRLNGRRPAPPVLEAPRPAVRPPLPRGAEPPRTTASVDVVVCVHDALEDVTACLDSVLAHSRPPFALILVDDGSSPPTRDFLVAFATGNGARLIRNEAARGYTRAANQGLAVSSGDYALLLNSDTVVTPGWLDRLVFCAESEPRIGLVGPLSNCASWQSVPDFASSEGDWSENPLPEGVTPAAMAAALAADSGPVWPRLPFLNGFCVLLKRAMLREVGLFDEESFGAGYGEENDYVLRARKAGWSAALADDAYVFHHQSRSYSTERRHALSAAAGVSLARKHGQAIIDDGVRACREDRVLRGLRERARHVLDRQRLRETGRARFAGRRVLLVLPVRTKGGGANVVFSEARAMRRMGVDARILNLEECRAEFERSYPDPDVPVDFARPEDVAGAAAGYDAVVATANPSVEWLEPLQRSGRRPVLGYYVQDFEPYFYPEGSAGYRKAWESYTRIPGMVLFCKTDWNRDEVLRLTGARCTVTGPSFDVDLFRPFRSAPPPEPCRIAAMVRPSCARRQPAFTLDVLERLQAWYGERVSITVFGFDGAHADAGTFRRSFPYQDAGVLHSEDLAVLMNEVHLFADLSTYQAMGLTALEAMGCGATALLPRAGGADSFGVHEENALFSDTSSAEDCLAGLRRLVEDRPLRERLMSRAIRDVAGFHPERSAHRILEALFPGE